MDYSSDVQYKETTSLPIRSFVGFHSMLGCVSLTHFRRIFPVADHRDNSSRSSEIRKARAAVTLTVTKGKRRDIRGNSGTSLYVHYDEFEASIAQVVSLNPVYNDGSYEHQATMISEMRQTPFFQPAFNTEAELQASSEGIRVEGA